MGSYALGLADTIAAISTPPGKGGVAVIRISGDKTAQIIEKIFSPRGKRTPVQNPRVQIYGLIMHDERVLDDGLVCYFPAPNSYTGEDIAELSIHGGTLISKCVLETVFAAGARPATAGEFTRRAYINGKITLSDAEGVSLLLEAESEGQIKLGKCDARDRLRQRIDAASKSVTSLLSSMYARIDYPDEDLGDFSDEECLTILTDIIDELTSLISTYKTGKAIRDGIKTALCGKPNVGKSSFYNLLSGEEAAIVTNVPGTTRDVLESKVQLGDILLRIYDTAGIHGGECDKVEAIGIDRSREKINSADLILATFDATSPWESEDEEIVHLVTDAPGEKIAIINKWECDSPHKSELDERLRASFGEVLRVSVKENPDEAIAALRGIVEALCGADKIDVGSDAIISSANQYAILVRARQSLEYAREALMAGMPQDVSSSDIEAALEALCEIGGRGVSEAVVADIFSKFCVGK